MRNQVEFKVYGKMALFTDPITKVGGEKFTYQIPTYQALKGICESIYWKPTFRWVVDEVRILNPIRMYSSGIRPIFYSGAADGSVANTLSIYTYLVEPEYEVRAHFEWNMERQDLEADRNENKHFLVAKRMIERGGRRDIFLGTRECQGYVEPVKFGEKKGAYDEVEKLSFGFMFYGFEYPSETGKSELAATFFQPEMERGVIRFLSDENTRIKRTVKKMEKENIKTCGLKERNIVELLNEEELQ